MDWDDEGSDNSPEEMLELAKTLTPEVVKRIIDAAGAFECPVCYDAVTNPRFVIPCGHDTCSECLVQLTHRAEEQATANGEGNGDAKCAICRGKISPGKIIDYEAFKKCHMPDEDDDSDDSNSDAEGNKDVDSDDSQETLSEDDDGADLEDFIVDDDVIDDHVALNDSDDDDDDDLFPAVKELRTTKSKGKGPIKHEVSEDGLSELDDTIVAAIKNKGKGRATIKNENLDDEMPGLDDLIVPLKENKGKGTATIKDEAIYEDTTDEIEDAEDKPAINSKGKTGASIVKSRVSKDLPDKSKKRKRAPGSTAKGKGKSVKKPAKKKQKSGADDEADAESETDLELGHDETERTIEDHIRKPRKSRAKGKKSKQPKKAKPTHQTLASMKREATKNAGNRKIYQAFLAEHYVSSAKTNKCIEILQATAPDVKTIIFSQFTTFLDLLEVPIEIGFGSCHRRYDGSMSANARNQAVVDFTDDPHVKIMLVSLKAGNAGLNLTAASQVIIMDPFWNPYIEMQAVDRAYRIGQMKPVKVFRIVVQNTVEDGILTIQERKRNMVEAALDENASRDLARLGQKELMALFKGDDSQRRVVNRVDALANILGPMGISGSNVYGDNANPYAEGSGDPYDSFSE